MGPSRRVPALVVLSVSWVVGVALVLAGVGVPATAAPAARAASITASPAAPVAGESVTITGSVPGGRRPVQLQRQSGKRWVTLKRAGTTKRGAFRVVVRATGATQRLRVLAPPKRRAGAVRTRVLTLRPAVQSARLAAPATAAPGSTYAVTATFVPARPGRPVQVQRFAGGTSWVTVATGRQGARGTATVRVPAVVGLTSYRTVGPAFRGAPALISPPVGVRVAAPPTTSRVSVSSGEVPGDQQSDRPDLSGDGRYVAFDSLAATLVTGDVNEAFDVFRRDRRTGTTIRVNPGTGAPGTTQAVRPTISADGRYVAFLTDEALAPTDTNGQRDVYVWDASTGTYLLVSRRLDGSAAGGTDGSEISDDGRFVVFSSTGSGLVAAPTADLHVYRWNRETGLIDLVSRAADGGPALGQSTSPSVSADGAVVAYDSTAADIVVGDANNRVDVFVWRASTGLSALVSATPTGASGTLGSVGASISGDGTLVAFASDATDLVAGDTNGSRDAFLRDVATSTTTLVSAAPDGGFVAAGGGAPELSADGSVIAYTSASSALVPGDTNGRVDVFLRRRTTGATSRVSVTAAGSQADGDSRSAALSTDGSLVAFVSGATNLVVDDTNGVNDVFVRG